MGEEDLIDRIYAGAIDAGAWPGILAEVSQAVGGNAATLQSPSALSGRDHWPLFVEHNIDSEFANGFLAECGHLDPFSVAMLQSLEGDFTRPVSALAATDWDDIRGTVFWNDYLPVLDAGDIVALILNERTGGNWPIISIHKARAKGAFDTHEIAGLARLAEHLRRATRIRYRAAALNGVDAATEVALAEMPTACVLLGRDGRPIYANRRAAAMLAASRALRLRPQGLSAIEPAQDRRLQAALAGARTGRPRVGAELRLEADDGPIGVSVLPLGAENPFDAEFGPVAAAVFLQTARPLDGGPARRLSLAFDLAPAQSDILLALIDGASPDEIALDRGRSVHTVRNQTTQLLGKMGVRRLSEVRALARLMDLGSG